MLDTWKHRFWLRMDVGVDLVVNDIDVAGCDDVLNWLRRRRHGSLGRMSHHLAHRIVLARRRNLSNN